MIIIVGTKEEIESDICRLKCPEQYFIERSGYCPKGEKENCVSCMTKIYNLNIIMN